MLHVIWCWYLKQMKDGVFPCWIKVDMFVLRTVLSLFYFPNVKALEHWLQTAAKTYVKKRNFQSLNPCNFGHLGIFRNPFKLLFHKPKGTNLLNYNKIQRTHAKNGSHYKNCAFIMDSLIDLKCEISWLQANKISLRGAKFNDFQSSWHSIFHFSNIQQKPCSFLCQNYTTGAEVAKHLNASNFLKTPSASNLQLQRSPLHDAKINFKT